MNKKYVIFAPHADDEVIGCHDLLLTGQVEKILFASRDITSDELIKVSSEFNCQVDLFDYSHVPEQRILLFPDPVYEIHPLHRQLGHIGESLLRELKSEVIFYTTNMNAPYIYEVEFPSKKKSCLMKIYPHKASLWKYEHKYFLFEGYTKWIRKWGD